MGAFWLGLILLSPWLEYFIPQNRAPGPSRLAETLGVLAPLALAGWFLGRLAALERKGVLQEVGVALGRPCRLWDECAVLAGLLSLLLTLPLAPFFSPAIWLLGAVVSVASLYLGLAALTSPTGELWALAAAALCWCLMKFGLPGVLFLAAGGIAARCCSMALKERRIKHLPALAWLGWCRMDSVTAGLVMLGVLAWRTFWSTARAAQGQRASGFLKTLQDSGLTRSQYLRLTIVRAYRRRWPECRGALVVVIVSALCPSNIASSYCRIYAHASDTCCGPGPAVAPLAVCLAAIWCLLICVVPLLAAYLGLRRGWAGWWPCLSIPSALASYFVGRSGGFADCLWRENLGLPLALLLVSLLGLAALQLSLLSDRRSGFPREAAPLLSAAVASALAHSDVLVNHSGLKIMGLGLEDHYWPAATCAALVALGVWQIVLRPALLLPRTVRMLALLSAGVGLGRVSMYVWCPYGMEWARLTMGW